MRAGIIGAGIAGTLHAHALSEIGVELTAITAVTPDLASRDAARLGVSTAHADAAALIGDPAVAVVHVCTPNAQHYPQCLAALEAGKHVVAEKPLATSTREAEELVRVARRVDAVHAICQVYRYYPMVQALRDLAARGELGRLRAAHGTWLLEELLVIDPSHWMLDPRQMGPSLTLADTGIHWWDLVEYTTGAAIREVFCETAALRANARAGEDTAAMVLRLDDGILATGAVSQAAPGHRSTLTLELIGERASASWDIREPDRLTVRELGGVQHVINGAARAACNSEKGSEVSTVGRPEGHAAAVRALLAHVYAHIRSRDAATGDYPTFVDGLHALHVLDALRDSARSGAWVVVSGGSVPN